MPLDFPDSPATNATYTYGGVTWKYDGAKWRLLATTQVISAVTTLPTSPTDGQEIYYQASGDMATQGVTWHLRYRSAARSGAGAWEFIGGSDLYSGILGATSTTTTTFIAFSSGPSLTIPRQGKYQITYGLEIGLVGAGGSADSEVGLAEAGTVVHSVYVVAIDQYTRHSAGETVIEDVATSATLDLRIRNVQGRNVAFEQGYIAARPRFIF